MTHYNVRCLKSNFWEYTIVIKMTLVVFFVWSLVMLTVQSVRQASGREMLAWTKTLGLGFIGATITSVVLFLFVQLF